MTFTLAPDEQTDAELMHRIAYGDPAAAARLWTRLWPEALEEARGLVDPAEVPGLAAEALIGTIAAIALGSGPTDDPRSFLLDAVRELGEDEADMQAAGPVHPDVFTSPTLVQAWGTLAAADRELIETGTADGRAEQALGRLQEGYLRLHSRAGTTGECVDTHAHLVEAVESGDPAPPISGPTWFHLSACVVCTEAFHELAHTRVALHDLLGTPADPAAVAAAAVLTALAADAPVVEQTQVAATSVVEAPVLAVSPAVTGVTDQPGRRRRPLLVLGAGILATVLGVSVAVARDGDPAEKQDRTAAIPDSGPVLESAPPAASAPATGTTTEALAAFTDGPVTEPEAATSAADPTTAKPGTPTTPQPSSKSSPRSTSTTTTPGPTTGPTSATPRPSSSSSPSESPTPSKTPSPSPTPTKTCSPLEVLLGCRPG